MMKRTDTNPRPPDRSVAALERVVERFARMLAAVGLRIGLDAHECDALVQSVRIRLWKATGASSEKLDALSTSYIYQTARSAALDLIRTRRRSGAWRAEPLDEAPQLSATDNQAETLEQDESVAQIMAVLETLASDRRTVVKLYLAGYTRLEIAERLGWTEARTRNLLYRGLDDLRTALRKHGLAPLEEN